MNFSYFDVLKNVYLNTLGVVELFFHPLWNVIYSHWDTIKDIVPAWIAWVSYRVAREAKDATQTQKEISANQYKLSLFEKRMEKYDELSAWQRRYLHKEKINLQSIDELTNITTSISILFNMKDLHINIELEEIIIEFVQCEFYDDNFVGTNSFKRLFRRPPIRRNIKKEKAEEKIRLFVVKILFDTYALLHVPQEPFQKEPERKSFWIWHR